MSKNYEVIAIFPIYGQFRAIWKPDSGGISVKPIFSFAVTFYLTKTENRTKGGSNFTTSSPQNKPVKSPPRLGLNGI